jgi:hypothetical protein
MLQRFLMAMAAAGAMAAAAAVVVIAAAFGVYALLEPLLGAAGAAGALALIVAILIGLAGWLAASMASRPRRSRKGRNEGEREAMGLVERLMDLVGDKPLAAAGVAAAAAVMALRNPVVISAILTTLIDAISANRKKRKS